MAAVIKAHPEVELIRVEGHTDHTASRKYNQWLSEKRAGAVRDLLVAEGYITADALELLRSGALAREGPLADWLNEPVGDPQLPTEMRINFEAHDAALLQGIEPGMVVAIDPQHPGQLQLASRAYDRTVAGCVSGANGINPGLTMQQEGTAAVRRLMDDGDYTGALLWLAEAATLSLSAKTKENSNATLCRRARF